MKKKAMHMALMVAEGVTMSRPVYDQQARLWSTGQFMIIRPVYGQHASQVCGQQASHVYDQQASL